MTEIAPLFTEMEQYIAASRATVAAGEELEMHKLDERIGQLCDMIEALSNDDRRTYESRLQELLSNLNALGNEMREQSGNVAEIPKHRNASVAYQTADSRDNFGKRDKE
ncbi:MAG: hypothetical protein SFX19_04215 [Alphaproteobacteria bacterium]|nr:hypothetical protein [Alphaproteobacteria bacterium]